MIILGAPTPAVGSADFAEDANRQISQASNYSCLNGYPCFELSDQYPQQLPSVENYPWLAFDFAAKPEAYLQAVLRYVLQGNVSVNWDISKNQTRKWYHAPWMHWGGRGREPIHGLTPERGSRWRELSKNQTRRTNNWAIGFYNPRGAFTIGQVWKDPTKPDSSKARFPLGTVSAKLLFTDATDEEAPYLRSANALIWDAQVDRNRTIPTKLRLIQLDIAVRDERADPFAGWVFGTFMFDGAQNGANWSENIVPVGLHWGNDPSFTYSEYRTGKRPVEGWINPYVADLFRERPPESDLGYLGRMNGPVDNPFSSCLACHGRSVDTKGERGPRFTPELLDICMRELSRDQNITYERITNCQVKEQNVRIFFRNLKSDEPFVPSAVSLDYSLQLAVGITNWHNWFRKSFPLHYAQRFPRRINAPKSYQILTLPAEKAFSRGDEDL